MSCENDCGTAPVFPRVITNRPALPRIDYRIGGYGEMRAHMLSRLDAAPVLAGWTHREADDPGIALLEGMAVVGDILSLYQDDYANECYLRTATLPDSVSAVVRLLGYRPAPGLGGMARFALAVKGDKAVNVPAGLALKAQLEGADQPATFETAAPLLALPALSQFHLYRPRRVPPVVNGMDTFQLGAADGVDIQAGDKLMVGLAAGPAAHRAYDHLQVMTVAEVWDAFGIRYVKTEGQLESLASGLVGITAVPGIFASTSSAQAVASAAQIASMAANTGVMAVAGPGLTSASNAGSMALFSANFGSSLSANPAALSALPAFSGVLAAGLAVAATTSVSRLVAWKLTGEHRHFGHQAPAVRVSIDANGRASEVAVSYDRVLNATQGAPAGPGIAARQLPLEGRVDTVGAGTEVLVEANLSSSAGRAGRKRLLARRVRQVDAQSMAWGSQSGAATVLTLDDDLAITESGTALNHADIRGLAVHTVEGAAFELRAAPVPTSAVEGMTLDFYGDAPDALALLQRTLLLAEPGGVLAASVQRVQRLSSGEPRFQLTLDRSVDYRLYGHDEPQVAVYGNLVDASEGKTEPASANFIANVVAGSSGTEAVLGDGDARQVWQTFALPKLSATAPLTYLLDATQSPPQRPELAVRVGAALWQRVDSFFDAGPLDEVYIVRQDGSGGSVVQFGDGVHGARLPSGRGNVTAVYRSGSGSRGALAPDASVSAQPRFTGFDKAFLLEPVTGGAAPEAVDSVRRAAPGTMQSLGRIVSLADFEAEAQALPGVLKARATWALIDASPVLVLTVLTDGLAEADRAALDLALRSAVAARGPARCALQLRLGNRRFAQLALRVGIDQRLRSDDVLAALRLALGTSADDTALDDAPSGGLFDWQVRGFGQDVHGSQVLGRVQAVAGVAWVELLRLADRGHGVQRTRAGGASPAALVAAQQRLVCPADSVLALHQDQLSVEWIAV
jgi:hypothetical protein